jgi:hypothetical protein
MVPSPPKIHAARQIRSVRANRGFEAGELVGGVVAKHLSPRGSNQFSGPADDART